jgi:hypothetical protein
MIGFLNFVTEEKRWAKKLFSQNYDSYIHHCRLRPVAIVLLVLFYKIHMAAKFIL